MPSTTAAVMGSLQRISGAEMNAAGAAAAKTDAKKKACNKITSYGSRQLGVIKGWRHEGIAAHLRLSTATVKNHRDRAFRRLGLHHRNGLFALVMDPPAAGLMA